MIAASTPSVSVASPIVQMIFVVFLIQACPLSPRKMPLTYCALHKIVVFIKNIYSFYFTPTSAR